MKRSACLLMLACALPLPGWCALGEKVSPDMATAAHARMHAASPIAANAAFTTRDTSNDAGTAVREFIGADGIVFAVRWQGPTMPDLRQLLGVHFARMQAAPRQPGAGHAHLMVRDDTLVFESHGHMRAFTGRAYLPRMLPAGVSVDQLE